MDEQKKLKLLIVNISFNIVISQILFWVVFFLNPSHLKTIDAFFVTGFFYILFALLRVVTSEGVFYSVSWSMKKVTDLFRKTPKYNYKYFDYVESRKSQPKGTLWPTFAVGGIYLIVSIIMLVLM